MLSRNIATMLSVMILVCLLPLGYSDRGRAEQQGQPGQAWQPGQTLFGYMFNSIFRRPSTIPAPVSRDYVDNDRDYQNLLDLLRKEYDDAAEHVYEDHPSDETTATHEDDSSTDPDGTEASEDCPICLSSMADSDVSMPQCKHEFHTQCLDRLARHGDQTSVKKCPLCKSPIIRTLQVRHKAN